MHPDHLKTVADLLGDKVETVERNYVMGNTAQAVKMNLAMTESHLRPGRLTLAGFAAKVKRNAA